MKWFENLMQCVSQQNWFYVLKTCSNFVESYATTCVIFLSEERMMPFVFRWDGGGREVYLSGSFNDWETDNLLMATNR